MSDEPKRTDAELLVELAAIRDRTARRSRTFNQVADDGDTLLTIVDYLQALVHDLREESAAYQRGYETGKTSGKKEKEEEHVVSLIEAMSSVLRTGGFLP